MQTQITILYTIELSEYLLEYENWYALTNKINQDILEIIK